MASGFHARLKTWSLSVPEYRVVFCLAGADGLGVGELAAMAIMTQPRMTKVLDEPVHAKLLDALLAAKDDRQQQIHLFYCLRLLHEGWSSEQKSNLLAWYDSTKTWEGGHSFTPFLENILGDAKSIFTTAATISTPTAMSAGP